jgi:D-glycero-D-manno-heptose 1,7-bisphosphate phosphatase
MTVKKKAVFLDKDGTLIIDVPYNVDPGLMRLSPDCISGLRRLQNEGYLLIVVSNQPGIARGYFEISALSAVEKQLNALLTPAGITLNGFYYCPHHPDGIIKYLSIDCSCRKPAPGLLLKAAGDLDIDLNASWMIGDILNDVEAGNRAGCQSILIDNGNETEWQINEIRRPAIRAKSINEAANHILKADVKQLARM